MKRKIAALVAISIAIIATLSACGNEASVSSGDSANATVPPAATSGDSSAATPEPTVEPVATPEPIPEPTPEPTPEPDPYAILEVSEATARERGGYYLLRGDKVYDLNPRIDGDLYKSGIGYQMINNRNETVLYRTIDKNQGTVALGNIPTIVLEDEDLIIGFGSSTMNLFEMAFVGYTVPVVSWSNPDKIFVYHDGFEDELSVKSGLNFEIRNADDNVVANYRDLPYGDYYTASWFVGTQFYEVPLVSNCWYYESVYSGINRGFSMEGELVRDANAGYAIFDFSDLSPGLYEIFNGAIVEVK